ncbi:uncharacterized protein C8Q71DRAFT_728497 [Rhodofomes roseus]|uniref:Uncharacterized protein n=1 Tax=Rhodofomes roseus TaxID=34475 RepID=A0ABQ8JXJ2_9APHY|nr:uncharacterized protein C8Q71DRAFT_728497 [Rhodofomes roseus]KAH9828711.1 hypothetical protein C8Q71DRAFT_728497 [Rhodofomes roseus]
MGDVRSDDAMFARLQEDVESKLTVGGCAYSEHLIPGAGPWVCEVNGQSYVWHAATRAYWIHVNVLDDDEVAKFTALVKSRAQIHKYLEAGLGTAILDKYEGVHKDRRDDFLKKVALGYQSQLDVYVQIFTNKFWEKVVERFDHLPTQEDLLERHSAISDIANTFTYDAACDEIRKYWENVSRSAQGIDLTTDLEDMLHAVKASSKLTAQWRIKQSTHEPDVDDKDERTNLPLENIWELSFQRRKRKRGSACYPVHSYPYQPLIMIVQGIFDRGGKGSEREHAGLQEAPAQRPMGRLRPHPSTRPKLSSFGLLSGSEREHAGLQEAPAQRPMGRLRPRPSTRPKLSSFGLLSEMHYIPLRVLYIATANSLRRLFHDRYLLTLWNCNGPKWGSTQQPLRNMPESTAKPSEATRSSRSSRSGSRSKLKALRAEIKAKLAASQERVEQALAEAAASQQRINAVLEECKQTREDLLVSVDEALSAASSSSRSRSSRTHTARTESSDQENSARASTEQTPSDCEVERAPHPEQPEPTAESAQSQPEDQSRAAPVPAAKPRTTPKSGACAELNDAAAVAPASGMNERRVPPIHVHAREGIGTQPYVVYRKTEPELAETNVVCSEPSRDMKYISLAPNDAFSVADDALDPPGVEHHEPASRASAPSGSARRAAFDSHHVLDPVLDLDHPVSHHFTRPIARQDARAVPTDARVRICHWLAELPVQLAAPGDPETRGTRPLGPSSPASPLPPRVPHLDSRDSPLESGTPIPNLCGPGDTQTGRAAQDSRDTRASPAPSDRVDGDTADEEQAGRDAEVKEKEGKVWEQMKRDEEEGRDGESKREHDGSRYKGTPSTDVPPSPPLPPSTVPAPADVSTNGEFVVRAAGHDPRTHPSRDDSKIVPAGTMRGDTADARSCTSDVHHISGMDAPRDDLKDVPSVRHDGTANAQCGTPDVRSPTATARRATRTSSPPLDAHGANDRLLDGHHEHPPSGELGESSDAGSATRGTKPPVLYSPAVPSSPRAFPLHLSGLPFEPGTSGSEVRGLGDTQTGRAARDSHDACAGPVPSIKDAPSTGRGGVAQGVSDAQRGGGEESTKSEGEEGCRMNRQDEHEGSKIIGTPFPDVPPSPPPLPPPTVPAPAGVSTNGEFVVRAASHNPRTHIRRDDSKVVPATMRGNTEDAHARTSDVPRIQLDATRCGPHVPTEVQALRCSSAAEPSLVKLAEQPDVPRTSPPLSPLQVTASTGASTSMQLVVRPGECEYRKGVHWDDLKVVPAVLLGSTADAQRGTSNIHVANVRNAVLGMHQDPTGVAAENNHDVRDVRSSVLATVPTTSDSMVAQPAKMEEGEGCGMAAGISTSSRITAPLRSSMRSTTSSPLVVDATCSTGSRTSARSSTPNRSAAHPAVGRYVPPARRTHERATLHVRNVPSAAQRFEQVMTDWKEQQRCRDKQQQEELHQREEESRLRLEAMQQRLDRKLWDMATSLKKTRRASSTVTAPSGNMHAKSSERERSPPVEPSSSTCAKVRETSTPTGSAVPGKRRRLSGTTAAYAHTGTVSGTSTSNGVFGHRRSRTSTSTPLHDVLGPERVHARSHASSSPSCYAQPAVRATAGGWSDDDVVSSSSDHANDERELSEHSESLSDHLGHQDYTTDSVVVEDYYESESDVHDLSADSYASSPSAYSADDYDNDDSYEDDYYSE